MISINSNTLLGAAYIRVSTDDQTELSPDAQLRLIRETARQDGFLIPQEFIFLEERGISGRRADNRAEFLRMIALAKSSFPAPFRRLYLWKFSRFARNQEESIFYKGILRKKCGVEIKSVSEPLPDGMFGKLIETIIEWFDEYYSVNLSGEVLRGMTEKALRRGYQAPPCLGYRAVGGGKPFAIRPEKMEIAEFIHLSFHQGMDISAIVREANRRGYHTNREHAFERRTVLAVLSNPFYIGTVSWNGITFQGEHPLSPVICSVFSENQTRLSTPSPSAAPSSFCRHWLSGLLTCAQCGASLSFCRPKGKQSGCFQCWKYLKGLHLASNSVSLRKAEQAVLTSLHEVLGKELPFRFSAPAPPPTLCLLQKQRKRIEAAYQEGIDSLEEYRQKKQKLETKICQLTQLLPKQQKTPESIQGIFSFLSSPDVSSEQKRDALCSILTAIVYDRPSQTFRFYYRAPASPFSCSKGRHTD